MSLITPGAAMRNWWEKHPATNGPGVKFGAKENLDEEQKKALAEDCAQGELSKKEIGKSTESAGLLFTEFGIR
ncbi:MAG: hypothetical protein GQ578_05440 [Desulfuromonadaceae bacterium]|nr:hypothetical protein [Desulfuromonadaceae bacterium]